MPGDADGLAWTLAVLRLLRDFRAVCDRGELDILFDTLTSAKAKLLLEDFRSCQTVEALATVLATATDISNEADLAHVHFNEKVELHHVKWVMDNILRRLMDAVVVAPETGELFQRSENDDGDDDGSDDGNDDQQKCAADVASQC